MSSKLALLVVALLSSSAVLAHGNWQQEVNEFLERRGNTENCLNRDTEEIRALHKRAAERRSAKLSALREELGIKEDHVLRRRQSASAYWSTLLATSHASTSAYDLTTPASTLFSSTGGTCVLNPETTQGPYYVLGEYFRSDMRESQQGVPLYLDVQVLDIDNCSPIADAYMDMWHCNATGVYSGVVASSNGNSADSNNIYNSWLRGVAKTNSDGVLSMTTIFPGHYTGRATHIHLTTRIGGTVYANGTYYGGSLAHVGQIFFDEALINKVEAVAPYNTNTQTRLANSADSIGSAAANGIFDPFVEYVLLGNSISDGILAWITVTAQNSASYSYSPAGYLKTTAGQSTTRASTTTTTTRAASTTTTTRAASTTTTTRAASTTTTTRASTTTTTRASTTTAASTSCVAQYGQCGGISYTGSTTCCSGSTCTVSNQYYSQCL